MKQLQCSSWRTYLLKPPSRIPYPSEFQAMLKMYKVATLSSLTILTWSQTLPLSGV